MNRSREFPFAAVVAAIAAAILVAGGILLWKKRPASEDGPSATPAETATTETGEPASLYFPATSGMLEVELRAAPGGLDGADRRRWLAEQLVAGPESPNLRPVVPAETQVASVFEAPDGTVYVDFTLPENNGGMGSTEELLTLYSVVNTLLLDDSSAQRVVLLINGRQRETLAGHLDTTRPLYARPDLIREAG